MPNAWWRMRSPNSETRLGCSRRIALTESIDGQAAQSGDWPIGATYGNTVENLQNHYYSS